jgi:hypothetical protein
MTQEERTFHLWCLGSAETQFRLSTAVRLAATFRRQPKDLPVVWSHGRKAIRYAEIALTEEEVGFGAWGLQRSATYLLAATSLEAIRAAIQNPKASNDPDVVGAYQIARLVRNAFAHSPQMPTWRIDPDCRDLVFEVPNVIKLDTTGIDDKAFDWRDYGGPLAILSLLHFVRREIMNEPDAQSQVIPLPERVYYQQGDLILNKVDEIPQ